MQNDPIQITRTSTKAIEPYPIADTLDFSTDDVEFLDSVADLLEYPAADWYGKLERCKLHGLREDRPDSEFFSEFCLGIHRMTLIELQELYTRTFDLNPKCALEIGYHLFGEDYKRGEFLARLREDQNDLELGQEKQLPDYLPVLLRLLSRTSAAEERAAMIGYCLIPGLDKIIEVFNKGENPYGNVIRFLMERLKEIADGSLRMPQQVSQVRFEYV